MTLYLKLANEFTENINSLLTKISPYHLEVIRPRAKYWSAAYEHIGDQFASIDADIDKLDATELLKIGRLYDLIESENISTMLTDIFSIKISLRDQTNTSVADLFFMLHFVCLIYVQHLIRKRFIIPMQVEKMNF